MVEGQIPAEVFLSEQPLDDGLDRHVRAIIANICSARKAPLRIRQREKAQRAGRVSGALLGGFAIKVGGTSWAWPLYRGLEMVRVRTLLLASSLLLGSACGSASQRAEPSASSGDASALPAAAAGYRLYVKEGFGQRLQTLRVVDAASGRVERELPLGVPAPDWSSLYVVASEAGKTTLRALDPSSGAVARETQLDGTFWIPYDRPGRLGSALSADGHWLVLTNFTADGGGVWKSRDLILDTRFSTPPRRIEMDGRLDFWALSNDGARLYLTEYLGRHPAPVRNRLRVYDFTAERLDPGVILDRSSDRQGMSVVDRAEASSPDGRWLYSLFTGDEQTPFVYALDLTSGRTFSVDLPWRIKGKWEEDLLWVLAVTPDGSGLYAANAALGMVAEIDTKQERLKRTANFPVPSSRAAFQLFRAAYAKRMLTGGAAMSPDGRTLFAPGMKGLVAVDTEHLTTRGPYLGDWAIDSLAMGLDGVWLYAVSAERQRLLQIAPRTGSIVAEVAGVQRPSGIYRVEVKR